ncbi:hypothetical protein ACP70R_021699 [Stipagrostis hirtigluma subsp. patula]
MSSAPSAVSVCQQRQRERRRRRASDQDGMVASRAKRKGSPCQQDDGSQGGETELYSGPTLPEDIWNHIHSLMPMRDAARAACVSHAFLRSWRRHPNLNFSNKALGLKENEYGMDESDGFFYSTVEHILKMHSGIGVKRLKIQITSDYSAKGSCFFNRWLQTAVTPEIEELTLLLPTRTKYNFPCTLLSNGSGDSIRYLHLVECSFRPTVMLGCLRSLTRLHLCFVRIKDDELGCLLSRSLALERLEIRYCDEIVCLKVPCLLQQLRHLEVVACSRLKVIHNEAPSLSSSLFEGINKVQLLLGETLHMKNLHMSRSGVIFYARSELPSSMPNLESLYIHSRYERTHIPMLHSKFIHLKHLIISLIVNGAPSSPAYDYLSLASFFDAAPSLETFDLRVCQIHMGHVSIFADLRQMQGQQHHHNLKSVKISGFCCAKSMMELACNVLERVISLECLILETPQSGVTCSHPGNNGKCTPLDRDIVMEGHRAVLAIKTYIEPKVPSTVKLHVLGPCSCHDVEL